MGQEIRYMEQSYPLEDNRTQLIKKYATIFRTTYFINVLTKYHTNCTLMLTFCWIFRWQFFFAWLITERSHQLPPTPRVIIAWSVACRIYKAKCIMSQCLRSICTWRYFFGTKLCVWWSLMGWRYENYWTLVQIVCVTGKGFIWYYRVCMWLHKMRILLDRKWWHALQRGTVILCLNWSCWLL